MQAEDINHINEAPKPKGKKLRKILLWIMGILLVLLTAPIVLVFVYEKRN